ncbi:8507_t:CDS:1, partial [Racocetra fulgida]
NKEDSLEKSLDNKEDSLETSLVNKEDSLEKSLDNKEDSLETIMTLTTIKLLKCMESFSKQRTGTDEVTQAAPTKLRQLVYTILGIRGFSGTPNEGEHPFIIKLRDLIMENLNKYRTIKGTQKIDEIKSMATELIHQIISIFCFRRNIQEPVVEYKWYKYSDKVDLEFMECPLDEVDEIMVDICSFPLIGTNLEHEDKYK